MPDETDQLLAQMDEALGLAPTEETPAAEEPQGPLRDPDTGKFAKADEPEPEAEEAPAAEESRLFAGKFQTADELEKAYGELQTRLGSQGQELGELRQLIEQRLPEQDQYEEPQYEYPTDLQDRLADNPMLIPQVAAAAYREGNDDVLDTALVAWEEHDRAGAKRFERQIALLDAQKLLHQQTAPFQEEQSRQRIGSAWQQVAAKYPDMNSIAQQIYSEAEASPEILQGANTPEKTVEAFERLYFIVKGKQAYESSAVNANADTELARNAKLSSGVATQSNQVVEEQPGEWETDPLLKALDENLGRYYGPVNDRG